MCVSAQRAGAIGCIILDLRSWMMPKGFDLKCGAGKTARAGVNPAASVHWLRRAHASHAIDNGAPITLVQATLGHADLKTTSVYAHAPAENPQAKVLKQIPRDAPGGPPSPTRAIFYRRRRP
jgi:Phage integrase family